MAAERVILENLERALSRVEDPWLLSSMKLANLRESLVGIKCAVAELDVVKNHPIRVSLKKLVALLHQADDLLDEVLTRTHDGNFSRVEDQNGIFGENLRRGLQRVVNVRNKVAKKVGLFYPYPSRLSILARKVEKTSQEFIKLGMLMLMQSNNSNDLETVERPFEPFQYPYHLFEEKIIGREEKKKEFIERLVEPLIDNSTGVSVIPIVGQRGIGKSAFAQLVYDDEKVKGHFDLRMWIQVSKMSEEEIIREIVESCTYRSSNKQNPKPAKVLNSHVHQNGLIFRGLLGCQNVDTTHQTTTPSHSDSTNKTNIYERRLQREIEGKLYLLVLDDACITLGHRLKEILATGARGSRILVTTKKDGEEDENEEEDNDEYELRGLLDDSSWSLFEKIALVQGSQRDPVMEKIGRAIAENCGGVPLTIKVAASLLYGKSKEYWSSFNNQLTVSANQKKDIMKRVLHFSYSDLPTRLKACFVYCYLFPDDYTFNKQDLLSLWIAQGFIDPQHGRSLEEAAQGVIDPQHGRNLEEAEVIDPQHGRNLEEAAQGVIDPQHGRNLEEAEVIDPQHGRSLEEAAQGFIDPQHGRSLEEAADKYFLELSRRCFIEIVTTDVLGNIVTCKMHPVMRNLAYQYSAGIVSLCKTDDSEIKMDSKHVSFTCDEDSLSKISSSKLELQYLRTLLSVNEPASDTKIGPLLCNMFISSFDCLKVLELHNLGIENLPVSIGKLIHLRYLDLSKNDGLTTLPKSVADLYNLHTLKLNSCTKLEKLCYFGGLINLGRFEIDECDKLTCMPQGLEKLTHLETLNRFVVGENYSKDMDNIGLKALKDLNKLRGRLAIELTGDWTSIIPEAASAKLSIKEHLRELKISWAKTDSNVEKVSHKLSDEERTPYTQLLEKLCPNKNLQILCIEGYRGGDFPNWAGVNNLVTHLEKLVVISIEGCEKCQLLPPFGELPSLKRLTLRHMANVQYMEGKKSLVPSFFPSLEELTLHNFYKLEGWREEVTSLPELMLDSKMISQPEPVQSFPRLTKLLIWNCPNLRSMPLFMKVTDLNLCNVNWKLLEACAKKVSHAFQQQVGIETSITHLQIKGCSDLESFEVVRKWLGDVSKLKHLVVERCHELSLLASELEHLPSLEKLKISNCRKLNLSDNGASTTDNLRAKSWIPSRIVRHISRTSTTVTSPTSPWTLLEKLRQLTLQDIPKMETLPEGLKHVKSLRSLWISSCPALTELPEWIGNLTELQHLHIERCRRLTSLPEGLQHIISLMKVEITECPELMERCKEHTGEDWYKIKHAQVLLHKSWRYGLMPELETSKNRSNVRSLTDVKYFIVPLIAAET